MRTFDVYYRSKTKEEKERTFDARDILNNERSERNERTMYIIKLKEEKGRTFDGRQHIY